MSNTRTVLLALNDEQCKLPRLDLKKLMGMALRVEKRMETKVMIEDEQRRYNLYCDRIEFYGQLFLAEKHVESCDLGSEYLDLISSIKNKYPEDAAKTRLLASFCPREMILTSAKQFESLCNKVGAGAREDVRVKLAFYKKAAEDGCSVIELLQSWMPSVLPVEDSTDPEKLKEAFLALKISDSATEDRGGGHFIQLRNQFEKVVGLTKQHSPAAINFSVLRHDVIAEVIHDFVYRWGSPMYVSVIYADGTEATPLPLFCLKQKKVEKLSLLRQQPVFNVGMMSARHSNDGLDEKIDIYWFRNQEISIGRTQAETDEVAYKKSKEQFLKMRSEGPYRIAFYQTGFQPAVVGFYRALAEELIAREKDSVAQLEVVPYYFMGGVYKVGKAWN